MSVRPRDLHLPSTDPVSSPPFRFLDPRKVQILKQRLINHMPQKSVRAQWRLLRVSTSDRAPPSGSPCFFPIIVDHI